MDNAPTRLLARMTYHQTASEAVLRTHWSSRLCICRDLLFKWFVWRRCLTRWTNHSDQRFFWNGFWNFLDSQNLSGGMEVVVNVVVVNFAWEWWGGRAAHKTPVLLHHSGIKIELLPWSSLGHPNLKEQIQYSLGSVFSLTGPSSFTLLKPFWLPSPSPLANLPKPCPTPMSPPSFALSFYCLSVFVSFK